MFEVTSNKLHFICSLLIYEKIYHQIKTKQNLYLANIQTDIIEKPLENKKK